MNDDYKFILMIFAQTLTLIGIFFTYTRNKKLFVFQQSIQKRMAHYKDQLTLFYSPLNALIEVNNRTYQYFSYLIVQGQGRPISPRNKADTLLDLDSSPFPWLIMDQILIPNNDAICKIIMERSHLIDQEDNIANYTQFILHAYMLKLRRMKNNVKFNDIPIIEFPDSICPHIAAMQNVIIKRFEREMEGVDNTAKIKIIDYAVNIRAVLSAWWLRIQRNRIFLAFYGRIRNAK